MRRGLVVVAASAALIAVPCLRAPEPARREDRAALERYARRA